MLKDFETIIAAVIGGCLLGDNGAGWASGPEATAAESALSEALKAETKKVHKRRD